jgi:16S rRNA processing protein RimM
MAPSKRGVDAAPDPAPGSPARLTVGLVRGVRGLRGHVRIELLTDRPEERFGVGDTLFLEGTSRALTIVESSAVADGPGWWLRFAEIPNREAADTLRDVYLEIEPPAETREPGRWYFHELKGLEVRGSDGTELGRVTDIYRAGGAEVFVVRGPRGEVDVPGVQGIVLELAPERGEMVVDMEALALDARPVEDEDYVRPRDRRPANPKQPKAPRPPRATPAAPAEPTTKGKGARKGSARDEGTRTLTPDEIAALREGPAASAPAPADPEPPNDAG